MGNETNDTKCNEDERKPLLSFGKDLREKTSSSVKPKRIITVEPVLVIFFVAVTAGNPIIQQYIYARFAEDLNYDTTTESNTSQCGPSSNNDLDNHTLAQQVQSMASMWNIILLAADLLPSMVSILILGAYSDKAGRKKAMVPPIIGAVIRSLTILIVVTFRLPLLIMVIGALIDGCLGGTFTLMMSSLAYIADISTKDQRALRILSVEIFSGLGQTVANIGAGYILVAFGFVYPCVIITILNVLALLYVVFLIEETVPKKLNTRLFTFTSLKSALEVVAKKTNDNRRWKIMFSFFIFFIVAITDFGVTEIITYYVLNPPFCWGSVTIGYFHSFAFVIQTTGSLVFLKLLHRYVGEYGLVVVSCLSGVGYYVFLAESSTTLMIFLGPVVGLTFKLALPMIRVFKSKLVQDDEQGSLFAIVSLMNIAAVVFGNFLFNSVYAATYSFMHGLVFYIGAVLFIIPVTGSLVLIAALKREKRSRNTWPDI